MDQEHEYRLIKGDREDLGLSMPPIWEVKDLADLRTFVCPRCGKTASVETAASFHSMRGPGLCSIRCVAIVRPTALPIAIAQGNLRAESDHPSPARLRFLVFQRDGFRCCGPHDAVLPLTVSLKALGG